jgi:hypothetical protein
MGAGRQLIPAKDDNEITNRRHLRTRWRRIYPDWRARRVLSALREVVLEDWAAVDVSAERDDALAFDGCLETLSFQCLFGSVENVDLGVAPTEAQSRPGPVDRYARDSNHDAPPSYLMLES